MSERFAWVMVCAWAAWAATGTPGWAQDPEPGQDGAAQRIPFSSVARGQRADADLPTGGFEPRMRDSVGRAVTGMVEAIDALLDVHARGGTPGLDQALEISARALLPGSDTVSRFLGDDHGLSERQLDEIRDGLARIVGNAQRAPDPVAALSRNRGILQDPAFLPAVLRRFQGQNDREPIQTAVTRRIDGRDDPADVVRGAVTRPIDASFERSAEVVQTAITHPIDGTGGAETPRVYSAVTAALDSGGQAPEPELLPWLPGFPGHVIDPATGAVFLEQDGRWVRVPDPR